MKRVALVLFLLGLLICIALAAYLIFSRSLPATTPTQSTTGTNPFGFSTTPNAPAGERIALTLEDGSTVSVSNFTASGQPEWASESNGYQVVGDDEGLYLVTYLPADEFGAQAQFLVSILAEPLSEVRTQAENALRNRLDVSNEELCALDIQVWTDSDVNASYAGRDLGLSFCPGATALP